MLSLGVAPLLPAAAEAVEGDLAASLTLVGVTPEEAVTTVKRFNYLRLLTTLELLPWLRVRAVTQAGN